MRLVIHAAFCFAALLSSTPARALPTHLFGGLAWLDPYVTTQGMTYTQALAAFPDWRPATSDEVASAFYDYGGWPPDGGLYRFGFDGWWAEWISDYRTGGVYGLPDADGLVPFAYEYDIKTYGCLHGICEVASHTEERQLIAGYVSVDAVPMYDNWYNIGIYLVQVPVPEPGTGLLVMTGVLVLSASRRRRAS